MAKLSASVSSASRCTPSSRVYSLFVLLPLTWMVFAAFKTKREIFVDPLGLPDTLSFDLASAAPGRSGSATFMLNSALVTFPVGAR